MGDATLQCVQVNGGLSGSEARADCSPVVRVCAWCDKSGGTARTSHGCCVGHYGELMRQMGVPEAEWLVVERRHPAGGWTHAVRRSMEPGDTSRVYEGWFSSRAAARRAMR